MILYGIFGLIIDIYEGRAPAFETHSKYILIGAGLLGLRDAIKKK